LGKHGPSWLVEGVEDDESPLGRARLHGTRDAERRRAAEVRLREREEATGKIRELRAASVAEVIRILQDRSESPERREAAASALSGLKCRDAVGALIEALAEGQEKLSFMCMWALLKIRSRCKARNLMDIARGGYPVATRRNAIYTIWRLRELRAEPLFIRVSAALDSEEELTRDFATEALGNTSRRPRTQRALSERLFDPSVSVRYSALCTCRSVDRQTLTCLRQALEAKLADPAKVDDNRVIAELAAWLLGRTQLNGPRSCS
jgi:hypothetical protein